MRKHSLIVSIMMILAVALTMAVSATVAAGGTDPIIGTWKLNTAKSKLSPDSQAALKEHTEVYREIEGEQIELT